MTAKRTLPLSFGGIPAIWEELLALEPKSYSFFKHQDKSHLTHEAVFLSTPSLTPFFSKLLQQLLFVQLTMQLARVPRDVPSSIADGSLEH